MEDKQKHLLHSLIGVILYDKTFTRCSISNEAFWEALIKKPAFNYLSSTELKGFFVEKLWGKYGNYGYSQQDVAVIVSRLVNPSNEIPTQYENEKAFAEAILKCSGKFNVNNKEDWESLFFMHNEIFDPTKPFEVEIRQKRRVLFDLPRLIPDFDFDTFFSNKITGLSYVNGKVVCTIKDSFSLSSSLQMQQSTNSNERDSDIRLPSSQKRQGSCSPSQDQTKDGQSSDTERMGHVEKKCKLQPTSSGAIPFILMKSQDEILKNKIKKNDAVKAVTSSNQLLETERNSTEEENCFQTPVEECIIPKDKKVEPIAADDDIQVEKSEKQFDSEGLECFKAVLKWSKESRKMYWNISKHVANFMSTLSQLRKLHKIILLKAKVKEEPLTGETTDDLYIDVIQRLLALQFVDDNKDLQPLGVAVHGLCVSAARLIECELELIELEGSALNADMMDMKEKASTIGSGSTLCQDE